MDNHNNYTFNNDRRNNQQRGGFNSDRGYRNDNRESTINLSFVEKGFRNESGNIREELITIEAYEIAKSLNSGKVTSSQLRAFYNEFKAIQNRIIDEKTFEENYVFILLMKSKADYKYRNNRNNQIPQVFHEFLEESVNTLKKFKSKRNFDDYMLFFEAIVGYYYGFGERK